MRKTNAILASLIMAVLFVVSAEAFGTATYEPNVGVVTFLMTTGDTLPARLGSSALTPQSVKYIRFGLKSDDAKYVKLYAGTSASGQLLFADTMSKDDSGNAITSATMQYKTIETQFRIPREGLYMATDATSVTAELYLYCTNGN